MENSWNIYFFISFQEQLKELKEEVQELAKNNPKNYKHHPKTKLLAKIMFVIFKDIAINPLDKKFNLGNVLGKKYNSWKRAKNNLPQRYRLFFKCNSSESKVIVACINNEMTLRKENGKRDVYRTFLLMLHNNTIPTEWETLSTKAVSHKK